MPDVKAARPMRLVLPAVIGSAIAVTAFVLLPLPAAAGLLTAGSAGFGVALLRSAARDRTAGTRLRAIGLGGGALLAGLAGVASGVSVVIAPGVEVDGVPLPAEIPLVCLFLAAALALPALLRPPQGREPLARLRVGLDTVGVAACLLFPTWLMLMSGPERRGATVTAILFGTTATAVAAVTGVHAIRHRAALQWCGPGAALSLLGLTALTVGMDHPDNSNAAIATVAAAAALDAAAAMQWWGATRVRPDAGPLPPVGSEPAAGFPLFALPVLGSGVLVAYHLVNGGRLDPTSIILATVALLAVAAREFVSAIVLRRQADHLADQGNRLRSLMFGSSDVAMVIDTAHAVRWQSPAAARHFGLSDQDVLGRPVTALVDPDQAEAVHDYLSDRISDPTEHTAGSPLAVRLRDGFGRWRETEWTAGGADPAEPGRTLVVHVRDISEQLELEQALRQSAHVDPHTGLANRQGLVQAGEPMPEAGALIVLELGGLTAIADVHGTEVVELVLAEVAKRLRTRVEGADVPARIGEARFAVLTHGGAVRAHVLASQLVTVLTTPYSAAGTDAHLSVWGGMTDLAPEAGMDEVIRRAALALRAVRTAPPGAVEWYDEEMEQRLVRRSTLEQDLPGALARSELEVRYQPIVELSGRRPVGVEAVLGWRHPTLGRVPAAELLPLAEELGYLGDVRHWMLHRAARQLAGWRHHHEDLWLSVNVRPRELADPVFQAALETAMATHLVPESAMVIEIAEHDLQDDNGHDLAGLLGKLRAQGMRTAVGNFGTGPTSLSRLRILPVDLLRVDREVFGQPADASRRLGAIMDVTVTLGRRLGMEIVAQGLQTADDLDTVQAAGCRLGQGDLLGRPLPAEHFEALLEQHRDRSHRG